MPMLSPACRTFMEKLELSPFDQTIARLFVHKLFCFPFPDASLQDAAVESLQQALSATILKWPFIAGTVSPDDDAPQKHAVKLEYDPPLIGGIGEHVFTVRNLSAPEFPWAYDQLAEAGMPLSAMNKDVLTSVPEWPAPGQPYPALAIQANFIEGGLIICFAFHHAVADGGSFITFIRAFADATRHAIRHDSAMVMPVEPRVCYTSHIGADVRELQSFPEYDSRSVPVHHAAYKEITTRILTFSAATMQKLEANIKAELKTMPDAPSFVSNIACLSGLIWIAVVRARRNRLPPFATTKIGIAINARSVMTPKLPEDYFGDAVVHTNATAKVYELLDADADAAHSLKPISVATMALAASRMRQAVSKVNSEYVSERLKTFSALSDPTEPCRAYTAAIDNSHTGLDFSSWREQGADIEFGIPGIGTKTVQFWRKTWSPNEGAYNILPRKGGSKGTADWEVSLGLSMEDMEKVCSDEELGAWTTRIVDYRN
ncbi:uncharacterized protein LTR77_000367 [Saxophila tyrrhenica]|uniref:Uncharacterized protein n=1 Tax=Saxophila tyrrhenica TaxID=1690608 RepID=A0AAV9PP05_9PEZI|nr:hypothetical protein LTR77_000367 [Saxophila tyrrhenica]